MNPVQHKIPISIVERQITGDPYRDWSTSHPTYDWEAIPQITLLSCSDQKFFTMFDIKSADKDMYHEDVCDLATYMIHHKISELDRTNKGKAHWSLPKDWTAMTEPLVKNMITKWRIAYNIPLQSQPFLAGHLTKAVCHKASLDFNNQLQPPTSTRTRDILGKRLILKSYTKLMFQYTAPGFPTCYVISKPLDVMSIMELVLNDIKPLEDILEDILGQHLPGSPLYTLEDVTKIKLYAFLRRIFRINHTSSLGLRVQIDRDESETDYEFLMNDAPGRFAELVRMAAERSPQRWCPTAVFEVFVTRHGAGRQGIGHRIRQVNSQHAR
jgi:hypothetical protein